MNAHNPWDLQQMQSLPLEGKIILTQRRIRDWYEYWDGEVYVSFSGGKDSTVLKHIVDQMGYDVPAVFVNTGLEYPEIQRFVRDIKDGKYPCFNSNVEIMRPEMRFDQVLTEYGYPVISKHISQCLYEVKNARRHGRVSTIREQQVRGEMKRPDGRRSSYNADKYAYILDADFDISHKCCNVMKKKPAHDYEKQTGRKPMIGTMADESLLRRSAWFKNGCNAFHTSSPKSTPLAFWTEQDVLQYLKRYDVPYCPVYGDIVAKDDDGNDYDLTPEYIDIFQGFGAEPTLKTTGCDRTGCMFCMFGCHLEKGENRFQRLKRTHPRQYEYCIGGGELVDGKWQPGNGGLGLGHVLDYIGVKYD